MARLLSVSRAARLVGTTRGALQKRIFNGELESFEGQVRISDLEKLYPQAELEDNSVIEHIEEIVEQAMQRARGEKLRSLLAPDLGTLAARVHSLSKELNNIQQRENHYLQILASLKQKIDQQLKAGNTDFIQHLHDWLESALKEPVIASKSSRLLTTDTLLKMIAAQVHLLPSGHEFFIEGNNSILDSGLSAGLALNYGCSNGNCGKCKARLISGEVKKIKSHDYVIPETERNEGYLLTCCHTAVTDVVLQADEAGSEHDIPMQSISARVKKSQLLADDLLLLHLKTPRTNRLRFLAGQNATLKVEGYEDQALTNIPIASCPCDDMNIQFHIKRDPDSELVSHFFDKLQNNDNITIEGPSGRFILKEDSVRPILFIAFNEGFAPIKSLIEHAMTLEDAEFIHLFWIVSDNNKHYMHNVCRSWTDALDDFRYTPLKIDRQDNSGLLHDRFEQIAQTYAKLDEFDIYIAGTEQLTRQAVQFLKEAGVSEEQLTPA
jgi:CDP-4-dehydro-6-deoxyglucose reductase